MNELPESVGACLRFARTASGVTTAFVCSRLKITETDLLAMEEGRKPISFINLLGFAGVYEQPLHFFFTMEHGGASVTTPTMPSNFDDMALEVRDLTRAYCSILNPAMRQQLRELALYLAQLSNKGKDIVPRLGAI